MKKLISFFLVMFFLHISFVFAQTAPMIQWQNTIGGSNEDDLFCIIQCLDSGYLAGGESFSNISGEKTENSNGINDIWIIKVDKDGNVQWQNTIGGAIFDRLFSLAQTSDGGYILGGTSTF